MTRKLKEDLVFLDKEEFFNALAEKCNYINTDLVKEVYYELIRLTSQELRKKGAIRFPDFGDFSLKYMKERRSTHVLTKEIIIIPMRKAVRFSPTPKLKRYFKELS